LLRRYGAACNAALLFTLTLTPSAHGGVIPLPAEVVSGPGSFTVDSTTLVHVPESDRDAGNTARYLVDLWTRSNGLTLPVVTVSAAAGAQGAGAPNAGTIEFRRRSGFGPEAYELRVTPRRITVSATSAAGLFYGAVTLWQLLPLGGSTGRIPAQTIRDAPAYAWRGLMLDSARHFQSPSFIRSMIDWMAWHKLNVLHWHLTDDQGWRLQIRKYPRLTSVGAWRVTPGGARYGGFYTQDEVRDIVRFAAARHVQIIPEIEMPGHATAAIAAYPALGAATPAGGAPAPTVSADWGVLDHHFNLEPQTFEFLDDVLGEVMALFPSRIIHIGGDEAGDPDALQASFTQEIAGYLAAHGRRIIGWDEILRPGLRQDAIVMSWHGVSGAHAAAMAGHDTVLAPSPSLYFDNRQSTLRSEPPGRLKVVSLEDVYRFEPRDSTLSDAQRHHVLGIQANLWTEHIQTEARVQWMALPRAAALAEVGWSSAARRRWPDFLERLVSMFARYRAFGLNYADSVFAPAAQVSRGTAGFSLILSSQAQSAALGDIHYTLDGREPSAQSPRYEAPLNVPLGAEVRAAAFVGSAQASRTWSERFDARTGLRRDTHDLQLCSDGIGLLLEAEGANAPLAVDIMNPCWIDRGVDLSSGPSLTAAVAPLPFNYEIGADTAKIRIGDARTPEGELEIHADGCDTPALARLPLARAAYVKAVSILPAQRLPRLPGRHDLCLRFARPRLDPLWALDWIEIRE
jgi:hexosaminidase